MILKTDSTRSVKQGDYSKSCYSSAMAEYLEAAHVSEGMADETTGDVDSWRHVARVGRWLVVTTSDGFVTATRYETEAMAIALFEQADTEWREMNTSAYMVCTDCYFAHHYGARVSGGQWYAGESDTPCEHEPLRNIPTDAIVSDWTNPDTGTGIEAFSRDWCEGCGSWLAGARYRLSVQL